MNKSELIPAPGAAPLEVAYAADFYRRYPGEEVTFYLRLTTPPAFASANLLLKIYLPEGLEPILTAGSAPGGHSRPNLEPDRRVFFQGREQKRVEYKVVFWRLNDAQLMTAADQDFYEVAVSARVGLALPQNTLFKSWAEVTPLCAAGTVGPALCRSEVVGVRALAQARSLKYLPAFYHEPEHELMWRYMMVFDRVWAVYEELLAHLPFYFDPRLAPPNFRAWLISWVGLAAAHGLPPAIQERLIFKAVELYQKRGTRSGLLKLLQVCLDMSDTQVKECLKVEENLAGNFMMGDQTRLSDDLIMGAENEVGKFSVTLKWPQFHPRLDETVLKEIINSWKPAHTTYELLLSQGVGSRK